MIGIKKSNNYTENNCFNMSVENIEQVVSIFYERVKKFFGRKFKSMYVYGSCARGEYTEYSDIDIFVLLNVEKENISKELGKFCELENDLNLENDVQISVVAESSDFFNEWREYNPLYINVLKEGIEL